MDLQALADFNLVAVYGGFGRASRKVDRPKATLSRHVAELEQALGVRLIERGGQSLRLTEEGQALHDRTHGLLSEIVEASEAVTLGASVPRGRLRVSAPIVFAHVALSKIAARFIRAYPEVQLEIVAEDREVDPIEEGYDLVIRINPSANERLVGRRFLQDRRLLVAHPDVPRPSLTDRESLSIKAVLLNRPPAAVTTRIRFGERQETLVTMEPVLRLSSLLMARDAVLAGAGVGLLPRLLVADDVEAGKLALWGIEAGPAVEIWALQSSRRLVGAKVRAFLDMTESSFADKT